MTFFKLPKFDELTHVEGMPKGCAWGVFDRDGVKDTLGTLNLLNAEKIRRAASEVVVGESVSLNWSLGAVFVPGFNRKPLTHKHIDFGPSMSVHGFDDEIQFNTQCSSQWDSLCHYGHQPSGRFYNDAKPTIEELGRPNALPTLDGWHKRGGLVGRGVLLDYKAWAFKNNREYSPFERHEISVADLEAVAEHQGTKLLPGDILIIRTGYTEQLLTDDPSEQEKLLGTHQAVGLAGNEESARWIWDHQFAAVAGDTLAFEVFPPTSGGAQNLVLHQYLLSLFGMPIGELWDLKRLSEKCSELKKWTFLLTSAPLNIPSSIASPPNALAVF